MKPDPIVEEVRKARSALVQRYGGDVDALCDALAAKHDPGVRYVAFAPKRLRGAAEAVARPGAVRVTGARRKRAIA